MIISNPISACYTKKQTELRDCFLYAATFKLDSWSGSGEFTQTVNVTKINNGPDISSESKIVSIPMFESSGNKDTNYILQKNLDLFNYANISFGNNQVTVSIKTKPNSDIEVIWLIKNT